MDKKLASLAAVIATATISARAVNYMIQSTTPLLAKSMGFSALKIGLLALVASAFQLVGSGYLNVVLGPAARRRAFAAASALAPPLLIAYWASNEPALWVLTAATGLAYGIIMPNLINLASPDLRNAERLLAVYTLSLSISLVIGPSYEALLLTRLSYADIYLFFLPLSLILAALAPAIKFPEAGRASRIPYAKLKTDGFISAALANTAYSIPFIAVVNYLPLYGIDHLGLPKSEAYSLFLPFFALSMATRLAMAVRPVRNIRDFYLASMALTLAGVALVVAAPNSVVLFAAAALLGVPHGSVYTLSVIMIARTTTLAERNEVNSLFSAYMILSGALAAPLLGALADWLGYAAMWSATGLTAAAFAGLYLFKYWRFKPFLGHE